MRSAARRSARSAMSKVQHLVEHPDDVLRLQMGDDTVFIAYRGSEFRHVVVHLNEVGTEHPIDHSRAVDLAQQGEADYVSLGYYLATCNPEDR